MTVERNTNVSISSSYTTATSSSSRSSFTVVRASSQDVHPALRQSHNGSQANSHKSAKGFLDKLPSITPKRRCSSRLVWPRPLLTVRRMTSEPGFRDGRSATPDLVAGEIRSVQDLFDNPKTPRASLAADIVRREQIAKATAKKMEESRDGTTKHVPFGTMDGMTPLTRTPKTPVASALAPPPPKASLEQQLRAVQNVADVFAPPRVSSVGASPSHKGKTTYQAPKTLERAVDRRQQLLTESTRKAAEERSDEENKRLRMKEQQRLEWETTLAKAKASIRVDETTRATSRLDTATRPRQPSRVSVDSPARGTASQEKDDTKNEKEPGFFSRFRQTLRFKRTKSSLAMREQRKEAASSSKQKQSPKAEALPKVPLLNSLRHPKSMAVMEATTKAAAQPPKIPERRHCRMHSQQREQPSSLVRIFGSSRDQGSRPMRSMPNIRRHAQQNTADLQAAPTRAPPKIPMSVLVAASQEDDDDGDEQDAVGLDSSSPSEQRRQRQDLSHSRPRMGNEVSKPQGAADTVESSRLRSRESTPPIGTGRYADDSDLEGEALENEAGPASSLKVEAPAGTQLQSIYDHPPAPLPSRVPFFSRPPPASDPEFRDGIPTLSSPNRVRPPSPPPATEPLPPQVSTTRIGSSKKSKKSRKSRSSIASSDDRPSSSSTNLASIGTPGGNGAAETAPSLLTKAERKALRKARREARKAALAAGDLAEAMDEQDQSVTSTVPSALEFSHSDVAIQPMPPPPIPSAVPSTPIPQANSNFEEPASINGLVFSGNGERSLDHLAAVDEGAMADMLGQETPEMGPKRKRKASGSSGKESRKKKSKRNESTELENGDAVIYASHSVEADNEMTDAPQEQQMLALDTAQDAHHEIQSNPISELSNGAIQAMVAGSQAVSDLALDPSLAALDSSHYEQQNGQEAAEMLNTGENFALHQQEASETAYRNRNLTPGPDAFSTGVNLGQHEITGDGAINQGYQVQDGVAQTAETSQNMAQENIPPPSGDQAAPETPTLFPGSQSVGRRKSKISYLDRQAAEVVENLTELPGQDAASPAVRNRIERAAKRKPRTQTNAGEGPSSSNTGGSGKKAKVQKDWAKGALSAEENAKIQEAVEEFRSEQGMSQFEVNEMIHEDPSRKGTERHRLLWEKVHASLPRRPPRIINYRTRKLFHNFIGRQVFTKEEDDELRRLVELKGPRWSEIGALINRSPLDIRDRWRNYTVCGDKKKADFWNQEEEARLVELVVEAIDSIKQSRAHSNQDDSQESAERDISWEGISRGMDRTRSAKQCREKWALLRERQRVASDGTIQDGGDRITEVLEKTRSDLRKMKPEDKLRLIEAVRKTNVELDDNIVWSKIGNSKFRKQWNRNTLRVMWARLRQTVERQGSMSTLAVADALIEQYKKDNVLVELGDSDVDNEAEVSLLDVGPSARKTYRTPRVAAPKNQFEALKAGGTDSPNGTPTKWKGRPKDKQQASGNVVQDEEAHEQGEADGINQSADESYVPAAKRPRNRKSGDGLQSNGRRPSASTKPETPGKYKSAQFVNDDDDEDDSGDKAQRSASPEVPASPERSQPDSAGDSASGLVVDSQVAGGDSQEFADEDRMETESVDLDQPDRSKSVSGSAIQGDEVEDVEDDGFETAPPRANSTVSDNSSVFAASKFKKRKSAATATPSTLRKTRKPRTPFSGGRNHATLSVYDDIESAHGESSQPNADHPDDVGIMSTQDEEAHQRHMELTGDELSFQPAEPEENDSEAERRRLAQLSDEDSDMEDIPAQLPSQMTIEQ
ncbi:hypothetical protein PspLS_06976 [Pyricularia sp. CBS 133598]|nr:hypothetical protein PspLS_06976 [Pyricularia sp. CBS 133598]